MLVLYYTRTQDCDVGASNKKRKAPRGMSMAFAPGRRATVCGQRRRLWRFHFPRPQNLEATAMVAAVVLSLQISAPL